MFIFTAPNVTRSAGAPGATEGSSNSSSGANTLQRSTRADLILATALVGFVVGLAAIQL